MPDEFTDDSIEQLERMGEIMRKDRDFRVIEEKVIEKIRLRREMGAKKYGVTMERTDLSRLQWLQHAQDEAMDFAIYLQKLIELETK